jgi:hypothetical protein
MDLVARTHIVDENLSSQAAPQRDGCAVAKFERAMLKERQREGIALAKKAGVSQRRN